MAMTLRLSDEETEALRRQAEREGRSMQEVARAAIADRIHTFRVAESAARGAERYAEVLARLADA
jgi:predicted transcriptional regulator